MKKTYGTEFKPKSDIKFMLKGSKTIQIMKGRKNVLFAYKQTRNIDILGQQGIPRYRTLFLAVLDVLSIVLTY